MTIRKLTIVVGLTLIALIATGFAFGAVRIQTVIMGGPIQQESQQASDLIADILPPPVYVIEPFLLASKIARQPAAIAKYGPQLAGLRKTYDARVAHWRASSIDPALRSQITSDVHTTAGAFWEQLDREFLPAARAGDPAALDAAFARLMTAYDAHRAAVDKTVVMATEYQGKLKADAERQIALTLWQLLGIGALIGAAAIGFVLFVLRKVVRPMGTIASAMNAMAQGREGGAEREAARHDEIGEIARALQAIIAFVAERARREADRQAATQQAVVSALGIGLGKLREGVLSHRIRGDFPQEYVQLRDDYNAAAEAMGEAIAAVRDTSEALNTSASEIAEATADLSHRTEQQAARLEETSAAMTAMTSRVEEAAGASKHAAGIMADTDRQATGNARVLQDAVAAMNQVQEAADEIAKIVSFIDGLAFQTNMLALNASIEAGRAGEAGKGFDVVANAVRALAERSADAARNIKTLTDRSSEQVRAGADLVLRSGGAMQDIIAKVSDGTALVDQIAGAATVQASGIVQIREAVASIDEMTQRNAAMGEQCNAAARLLRGEADRLHALVGRFDTARAA